MPGFTVCAKVEKGMSGSATRQTPDALAVGRRIRPRSTFHNCGDFIKREVRKNAHSRDARIVIVRPSLRSASASLRMVRNLWQWNITRPSRVSAGTTRHPRVELDSKNYKRMTGNTMIQTRLKRQLPAVTMKACAVEIRPQKQPTGIELLHLNSS